MATEAKDAAYLNQSYYGPSIQPQQSHPRPVRSAKCCTPYSLLCAVFKAITTILITIGVIVLVLWLIYQPDDLRVYVDNANLTRFDLAPNNNTLYYDLNVDLSFRNPNKRVEIYYDRIEAMALYGDTRFGYVEFPRFHQGHKNTTVLHARFSSQAIAFGGTVNETYGREKGEGWFYVDVKVYTKVRLRRIVVNRVRYTPEVNCNLRLPVPTNASSVAVGFVTTKCDVDDF